MLPMLIAALFIVEKIWKQPKYPLIDEWIKKCVCVYVCISAIKKNKILPPETAWMNFEGIMSSEINQTDKDKSFIISLICGILKNQTKLLTTEISGSQRPGQGMGEWVKWVKEIKRYKLSVIK